MECGSITGCEGEADRYIDPEVSYRFYEALYDVWPEDGWWSTRIGSGLGDFAATGDDHRPWTREGVDPLGNAGNDEQYVQC